MWKKRRKRQKNANLKKNPKILWADEKEGHCYAIIANSISLTARRRDPPSSVEGLPNAYSLNSFSLIILWYAWRRCKTRVQFWRNVPLKNAILNLSWRWSLLPTYFFRWIIDGVVSVIPKRLVIEVSEKEIQPLVDMCSNGDILTVTELSEPEGGRIGSFFNWLTIFPGEWRYPESILGRLSERQQWNHRLNHFWRNSFTFCFVYIPLSTRTLNLW